MAKTEKELKQEIQRIKLLFERWQHVYSVGGTDPFWSDGTNLNLIRNQISYKKHEIKELCTELSEPLPELCIKETPFEVSNDYFARKEEIIETAQKLIGPLEQLAKEYPDNENLQEYISRFKDDFQNKRILGIRNRDYNWFFDVVKRAKSNTKVEQQETPVNQQLSLYNKNPNKSTAATSTKIIDMTQKLLPIYNQCLNSVKLNWINYLNCATNVHNHNVTNQVMIFGQSKNSQLVADEKTWNKLGRCINFNAEHISTIVQKDKILMEQKLYDINQTYGDDVDIDTQRFAIRNEGEATLLNTALSLKCSIKAPKLKDAIQTLVSQLYKENPIAKPVEKYESLLKNSVYYIICKKLNILPSIDYANKFREIQSASLEDIFRICKSVNAKSRYLLNEIEKEIIKVRSNIYERESNNEQQGIHNRGRGLVQERGEQYSLQAGVERSERNSDTSTTNRTISQGGQLSFGQIRETVDDIHGREPRGQILGVDNSRIIDEKTSRARGTTQGYENIIDGANREEKSSSHNRRFFQGSEPHGMDTISSGGNGEAGTLHSNLTDKYKNSLLIGSVVNIDERKFKIENVDFEQNSVELQDVTFKESMGYPIFRKETTDFVYSYMEKQELNKINFHYDSTVINNDSAISYGGAKTKYKVNIEAIQLLKQIESEDRLATAEEQYTLARYTGFGGISQAFDSNAKSWENEYNELSGLLTSAEYEKARESTLTAYYTEPMIIKAMYQGLLKLGVDDKSKILEPSMGVGNFFGMLPNELQQCELHGVELDDLTGRIAKQLYQNADIQIKGYQDTMYQDNLFDVSIGNVPFGDFKVSDDIHSFLVHDYFFAKTIDKVKPNGVVAFISSKGTLDKANSTFRKYMAQRAELIGAVRLPNTAFKAIAGTEATTDIIFLRKREKQIVCEPEWVHVGLTENNVPVNQYYIDNPQNLLGEMVLESSQFGQSAVLKPFDDFDLYGELEKQIVSFAKDAGVKKTKTITKAVKSKEQAEQFIDADSTVKNYSYTIIDDNIYYRENDTMSLCDFSGVKAERVKGLHQIRTALRAVIDIQLDNYSELIFEERLINLNEVYDGFVKKYGYINDKVNKNVFEQDSDIPLLMSIEDSDTKGNITKTKIFAQATIRPKEKFVPKTYDDLITLSMSMKGHLDIEYMADNFNCSQQDVIDNLKGKIYFNPIYSD